MRALLLGVSVLFLSASRLPAEDVVKLQGGRVVQGTITALGATEIVCQDSSGKTITLANQEVSSFQLGDPPPSLKNADLAAGARDYERAIAGYRSALEEVTRGRSRALHRQFVYRKLARAQRDKGDLEAALSTLRTLLETCGPCRLRAEAFRESVEIARQKKDGAALAKLLDQMQSEPPPAPGLASLERARTKLEASDAAGALEMLEPLTLDLTQACASEARLLRLRCLRVLKRTGDLEKAAGEALDADPRSLLAGDAGAQAGPRPEGLSVSLVQAASSILAEALLARAGEDRGQARQALFLSAKALALGPPSREEEVEDYARALLSAARCCLLLAHGAPAAEVSREYRTRAAYYLREASRSYRKTEWGKTAAEEIVKLGAEEQPRGSP